MLSFEVDERITTIHTVWDHLQCCQTPLAFVQNQVHFSLKRMHLYFISPLCGFGSMDQKQKSPSWATNYFSLCFDLPSLD